MSGPSYGLRRRTLLASTAAALLFGSPAPGRGAVIRGGLPWRPNEADPPVPVQPGPWTYFTPEEAADIEAMVDRLVPPDPKTPGGKDAGCAVFIDRQLSGPFGTARGLYMRPPFQDGTPQQGMQSPLTPAARYRQALAAIDQHCKSAYGGKPFAQIPDAEKDKLLTGLEKGDLHLEGTSGTAFFELLIQNTKEGFFADPVYGGNRDMVAWKMIGFAGTRYDYRDWVDHHNQPYPLPPVGITGRPAWNAKPT